MNIQSLLNVRIYAVTSLGKLNDKKAVPALIDVMKNEKENDLVRVEVNGKNKVLSIEIKSDSFEDKDLIQDMIVIALNKVNEKISKEREKEMGKLTGGMKMPGVF